MTRREGDLDEVLRELLSTGLDAGERIEIHDGDCGVGEDGVTGCTCEPDVIHGPLGQA